MSEPVPASSHSTAYPPSGPDGSPEQRRGSHRGWLIAVPAVVVLAAAGGGLAYAKHQHNRPSGGPQARAAHKAGKAAVPATYTLPATIDGLAKAPGSPSANLADAAAQDLAASLQGLAGPPVVGSYSGDQPDSAVLIGLPSTPEDSAAQISNIFDDLRSTEFFNIAEATPYDSGRPGALMQCADASLIGGVTVSVGICVESDRSGTALMMRFTKTGVQTAAIMKSVLGPFEAG